MRREIQLYCIDCGDPFIAGTNVAKRCPECADINRTKLSVSRNRRARAKKRGYILGQTVEQQVDAILKNKSDRTKLRKAKTLQKV